MVDTNPLIKQSKLRIVVALGIIAMLASISFVTMESFFKAQQLDASLVNQAGRQRMLSQHISLGIQIYLESLKHNQVINESARSMVVDSSNLMLSSHNGLVATTHSDNVKPLYFNGEPSLDHDIRAFISTALSIIQSTDIKQVSDESRTYFQPEKLNYLLFRLNAIVDAYEEDSNQHISNSAMAERFIWAFTLLVLLLEYIYIFKPTLALIQKGFAEKNIKHNRMQLAADSAQLGIWEFDIHSHELHWDKQMWLMFYESAPLSPLSSFELFEQRLHPDDKQFVINEFMNALQQQRTMDFSFRILTPNHNLRYVHVHSILEYDTQGNVIKIVGTNQDISEHKNKEAALIEAKEKAEAATQIKGDFLASMSHEIRTPLNGVMGMLGLLKNTPLTQLQKQRVEVAHSSAQSLLALINDILDFSKIEADKIQIEAIDFDLNKLLAEVVDSLAQLAENKNIELILDTVKIESSRVLGDPGRIRQLLTNLLANAIKFTHDGHVILSASLTSYSQDQWQLDFSVEDTGIGIAEHKQSQLFDAFSQVDASTTREYGGTGLGLAIVKRLCIAMGGGINVSSRPNRGSRFYGRILVGKSNHAQIIAPDFDVSQLNILIVDDNSVNLSILSDQLSHWGITVTMANSGQQALQVCEQRVTKGLPIFDVAILDMQMPNMDGAELGRSLKQDPRFHPMHLVMMTSMLMDNDSQFMADIGFCAYFSKPVNTSDLFLALSVIGDNGEALRKAAPLLTHDFLNSLSSEDNHSTKINTKETLSKVSNKNVLLVEDNAINQLVACDLLEDLGLIVTVAEHGLDAINTLNAQTEKAYCLILMDCQMPHMDGFEATRQIRAGHAGATHQHTPIIALTANTMKGDQQRCLDAGMNDFIAKPIENRILERVILSWLSP